MLLDSFRGWSAPGCSTSGWRRSTFTRGAAGLAMREGGIPLWLDSPMAELLTDADRAVTGALVETDGGQRRIGARLGVILASGGFDHDLAWRKEQFPVLESAGSQDLELGNPPRWVTASARAKRSAPQPSSSMRPGGSRRSNGRTAGCSSSQRTHDAGAVRRQRRRKALHQRGEPYLDFGHAMIDGQKSGVTHIPCWLITDHRSWNRMCLRPPADTEGPLGRRCPRAVRSEAG